MQTLRKKNSPCKYKNDPSRFLGEGMTFKAKLIGILEVNEARGDKMCQDALNDLKTAIRAAGEHKQRITISIAIDGLRLRDEKTGDCMYHHPVHKISFIAQDMSDSRAFGYIFGSPDTGHRFFGIKTDKTASQVVIAMRDLFQVVFELKKKEIEMAKHHIEQHQIKYGGSSHNDSLHSTKDDADVDKVKGKYPPPLKTSCITIASNEPSTSTAKANTSEAIADLLDLEHELNSIQQGINQMERITPSDPFGPLSKGDPFLDPFDDSFSAKTEKAQEIKAPPPSTSRPSSAKNRTPSQSSSKDLSDAEKPSSLFGSAASTSSKTHFFSQFSPSITKAKAEDSHWFDQETESLFNDTTNVNSTEPTSSPVTFYTPTADPEQAPPPSSEDRKSPIKTDVFTELDPLGTGRVKPYVDKKDFFQELKNPPKKVLKELITENSIIDSTHYFPANFDSNKSPQNSNLNSSKEPSVIKNTLATASTNILNSFPPKDSSTGSKYSRIDPFEDTDPFEKTDPFLEESFPQSIGFPPLFSGKSSFDGVFPEPKYDKIQKSKVEEPTPKMSPPKSSYFSASISSLHGPLRVSLPPEKLDNPAPLSISTITSKFRSSPSPPEESKSHRRKHYQALKQSNDDRSSENQSPTHEELYSSRKSPKFGSGTQSKSQTEKRSPYKDRKSYFAQSPPPVRYERSSKMSSSVEFLDATPDPPPRPKTALFSIKPPPLPPKKQNQPNFKPPARPPSIEDNTIQYDYIKNQEENIKNRFDFRDEPKSPRLKREISTGKDPPAELRKQNSDVGLSNFPILPPPPQRKSPADQKKANLEGNKSQSEGNSIPSLKPMKKLESNESVLNITLNQLDKSGLENLATTLGIPSENIYNMTLQELTKRLAQKYLGPPETSNSNDSDSPQTFQADFDANFGKTETKNENPLAFDKYAAFKELIENENKKLERLESEDKTESEKESVTEQNPEVENSTVEVMKKEEEDKYAALRQLSLCAQKSENLSEELDVSNEDDSSARADNISDILRQHTEDSFTPINNIEMGNDSPITKSGSDWPNQSQTDKEDKKDKEGDLEQANEKAEEKHEVEWMKLEKKETEVKEFSGVQDLYASRPASEDKKDEEVKENWATFEKAPTYEEITPAKPTKETINENENSPFSSDGKEDVKEIPFNWHKKQSRTGRNEVPWQDEDESWDDYSPKESYWSDESSHEDRSPDKREERYQRRSWNKHTRMTKAPEYKNEQWNRREKWHEDTEDEYDESWRKHRYRLSSGEGDKKMDAWEVNDYDGYEKPIDWCNSRNEGWDENERYSRVYGDRRKRSESDDEYRRRCDSDASDREYVWTFKRNYPENYRGEKQKQYYMSYSSRDYPERCHESRSKHKKPGSHKRPSSASETKRNYEKMYSPVDHMPRSMDKVLLGKRESEEEDYPSRYHFSHKDSRYYCSYDSGYHYNSYDRRSQTLHSKRMSRGSRNDSVGSGQNEIFSPPAKLEDKLETKDKPYYYYPSDSIRDQNLRNKKSDEVIRPDSKSKHFQFEDDFLPSGFDRSNNQNKSNQSPKPDPNKSPSRKRLYDRDEWTPNNKSKEDSFFKTDNNNENFANFNDDFKSSPKKINENSKGKNENTSVMLPKPHMKGKNHFAILNRQDSSASLRKSESINIFSRENDPFEDDDFFSNVGSNNPKLNRFTSEKSKSKSNSNVSDPFTWKEVFGDSNFQE